MLSEEEEEEKIEASDVAAAATNGNGNVNKEDDHVVDAGSGSDSVQNLEHSLSPRNARKRHRSADSGNEEVEELPSPMKKQNTLGMPGANIKIASRGM